MAAPTSMYCSSSRLYARGVCGVIFHPLYFVKRIVAISKSIHVSKSNALLVHALILRWRCTIVINVSGRSVWVPLARRIHRDALGALSCARWAAIAQRIA